MIPTIRHSPLVPLLGVTIAALFHLQGCATRQQTGALGGAAIGGAMGGIACRALSGDARTCTAIGLVGAGVGGLAGSAIGKALDDRERERAESASRQAVASDTRKQVRWESDRGRERAHGSAAVVDAGTRSDGARCKQVSEVAYVAGEEIAQTATYCQAGSGGWERQSASA